LSKPFNRRGSDVPSQLLVFGAAALLDLTAVAFTQSKSPADDHYMAAMERMDQKMKQASDADPAVSFAKKMMVHHQGSIETGDTVLQHTKDPAIRKMAEKMKKDQSTEIKDSLAA
jgi:uncharacterized protein (DUF305 family)